MIMGQSTTLAMLFGAVVGYVRAPTIHTCVTIEREVLTPDSRWGILSPIAKHQGWAPGLVNDWKSGSRGWIVWISLAIMLADSIVSITLLTLDTVKPWLYRTATTHGFLALPTEDPELDSGNAPSHDDDDDDELEDALPDQQIDQKTFLVALLISTGFCIAVIKFCFPQVPAYVVVLSLVLSFLLSVMAVRALGQTDLNPVSGISKSPPSVKQINRNTFILD